MIALVSKFNKVNDEDEYKLKREMICETTCAT